MMEEEEVLLKILDVRVTLFNKRRDHEWKVFFAALALIGGLDALIIKIHSILKTEYIIIWSILISAFIFSVLGYEICLTVINHKDHNDINKINEKICEITNISIENTETIPKGYQKKLFFRLWAFYPKIIILAVILATSLLLPHLIQ